MSAVLLASATLVGPRKPSIALPVDGPCPTTNTMTGRRGRRSSSIAGRSAGQLEASRCEESFEAVAESADVGAYLAGGSAAGDISGVGAVDAYRHEVVPVGAMHGVGPAQFAQPAEHVGCFDLVDNVALPCTWDVVKFGDGFFVGPFGSAGCCRSDAAEDAVVEAVHRRIDAGDHVNGVDDEIVEGFAETCPVVVVGELPQAGSKGGEQ